MELPSHLLQPLSIDTNIIYDLDTTLFPGLDHPQHTTQPALLVASPEARQSWLSALKNDDISEDLLTDDLFDLIEESTKTFQDTDSSDSDSTLIQSVFDDIIDSTSSNQSEHDSSLSDVTWFPTDSCPSSPCSPTGQQVHQSPFCRTSCCASSTSLKRKRECEDLDLAKRSKLDDIISSWIYVDKWTYDICVRGF